MTSSFLHLAHELILNKPEPLGNAERDDAKKKDLLRCGGSLLLGSDARCKRCAVDSSDRTSYSLSNFVLADDCSIGDPDDTTYVKSNGWSDEASYRKSYEPSNGESDRCPNDKSNREPDERPLGDPDGSAIADADTLPSSPTLSLARLCRGGRKCIVHSRPHLRA